MPEVRAFPSIPTKILLPIDFSPSSKAALEMATDLALHFHAELFLVNVQRISQNEGYQSNNLRRSWQRHCRKHHGSGGT